jgi:hypothetical protein
MARLGRDRRARTAISIASISFLICIFVVLRRIFVVCFWERIFVA